MENRRSDNRGSTVSHIVKITFSKNQAASVIQHDFFKPFSADQLKSYISCTICLKITFSQDRVLIALISTINSVTISCTSLQKGSLTTEPKKIFNTFFRE